MSDTTIPPVPGRIVWIRDRSFSIDRGSPEAATIVYVWNDRLINVVGHDANGAPFTLHSVKLVQPGDEHPHAFGSPYAEWMPYQKGQAAKTEQLERAASSGV